MRFLEVTQLITSAQSRGRILLDQTQVLGTANIGLQPIQAILRFSPNSPN